MKTSLTDIIKTEYYLCGGLSPEESLIFQARLVVDQELRKNTRFHKMVHRITCLYARKRAKSELERLYQRLLSHPGKATIRNSVNKFGG